MRADARAVLHPGAGDAVGERVPRGSAGHAPATGHL